MKAVYFTLSAPLFEHENITRWHNSSLNKQDIHLMWILPTEKRRTSNTYRANLSACIPTINPLAKISTPVKLRGSNQSHLNSVNYLNSDKKPQPRNAVHRCKPLPYRPLGNRGDKNKLQSASFPSLRRKAATAETGPQFFWSVGSPAQGKNTFCSLAKYKLTWKLNYTALILS